MNCDFSTYLVTKSLTVYRKYEAALKALVTNYEFENDRRYHAYKAKSI